MMMMSLVTVMITKKKTMTTMMMTMEVSLAERVATHSETFSCLSIPNDCIYIISIVQVGKLDGVQFVPYLLWWKQPRTTHPNCGWMNIL
jgi:hypothetical protein